MLLDSPWYQIRFTFPTFFNLRLSFKTTSVTRSHFCLRRKRREQAAHLDAKRKTSQTFETKAWYDKQNLRNLLSSGQYQLIPTTVFYKQNLDKSKCSSLSIRAALYYFLKRFHGRPREIVLWINNT